MASLSSDGNLDTLGALFGRCLAGDERSTCAEVVRVKSFRVLWADATAV